MIKIAEFFEFGPAAETIQLGSAPDFNEPEGDQVIIDMLVMSINPADLLTIEGNYGIRPKLPNTPGAEGVGRVAEIGPDVRNLKVGDIVLPLGGGSWRERVRCRETMAIKLPDDIDLRQAAMIKANPATAEVMLSSLVDLKEGDWVIQNASNSAVGRYVLKMAKHKKLKVAAIVRRKNLVEMMKEDGADCVLVADAQTHVKEMVQKLDAVCKENRPKLALDAIGGYASNQLAACLADSGKIYNYGLLSGKPCEVDPFHLVFRAIELRGFWLADWFKTATPSDIADMYGRLIPMVLNGEISGAVEAVYPLEEIKTAVAHAAKGGRSGKILLTTNRD